MRASVAVSEDRRIDPSGALPRPADTAGEERLRRLRVIALVVPAAFLLLVLLARGTIVRTVSPTNGHLLLDGVLVAGTLAFSLVMFSFIDRSYRALLQQNRDLAAIDAVVVAARGAYTADAVAHESLEAILQTTGAASARIAAAHPTDPRRTADTWYLESPVRSGGGSAPETVPLLSGPEAIGSLTLEGIDPATSALTPAAYAGIGRAIGSALQRARYMSHLQQECHDAALAERDRIAREMHDSLAQALGAAHFRLTAIGTHPDVESSPEVHHELADLAATCHDAYGDVREAILGLREAGRADRTLLQSLDSYVEKFSRQSGIATALVTPLEGLDLPPHHEIQVIRVVQEALTNVRKHSGARSARVRIESEPGSVLFVVEDDGRGFDAADLTEERYGLATMTERTQLLDGWLTIDSSPGHGTRIVLGVPAGRGVHAVSTPVQA